MFTLSDASKDTKIILKWLGIGIVTLICIFFLIKAIFFIKDVLYPAPPPKPTVAFGKLQPAVFPANVSDKKFKFTLNTNSGNLPSFPDQYKVYVINPNEADLLALKKMQQRFYFEGYISDPIELSNQIFRFQSDPNREGIPKTIDGNIVDSSFSLNSSFISSPVVLEGKNLPGIEESKNITSRFLNNVQSFKDDIDPGKTKTKLFTIKNGALVPSTSISTSLIVEVDYYQKDVNKTPIFYEDATSSNIKFLVGSGNPNPEIVGGKYVHQEVNNNSSTYPIKTAEEAFTELKNGKAFISSYFGDSESIAIKNIFLAYYVSSHPQDFTLPVFVFEGNNGFYAYVSAVKDGWISK